MKLKEFIEITKDEIREFEIRWAEEAKSDPEGWPMEMDEGDWFDQLISHMTGRRNG